MLRLCLFGCLVEVLKYGVYDVAVAKVFFIIIVRVVERAMKKLASTCDAHAKLYCTILVHDFAHLCTCMYMCIYPLTFTNLTYVHVHILSTQFWSTSPNPKLSNPQRCVSIGFKILPEKTKKKKKKKKQKHHQTFIRPAKRARYIWFIQSYVLWQRTFNQGFERMLREIEDSCTVWDSR